MAKIHKSKLVIEGNNKSALKAIDGVGKKLGQANRDIKGMSGGIASSIGSIGNVLTSLPFIAATAVTGVVAGLGDMIKSTIDTAEHIEKMSQRVGVSAEALSTLSYAAQLSGTDIGVFEKAIQRLSRNMDDAAHGIGDGRIAFEEMGISVVDNNGKLRDAEDIMKDVADRFGNMEDGTKKTALALKIFGRAGADLIPMLNGGSAGLNGMQQEARDLGLEISTNTAKQAAGLKDDMLRLQRTFTGIATEITTDVLPTLNKFSDWILQDAIPGLKNIIIWLEDAQKSMHDFSKGLDEDVKEGFRQVLEHIGDELNKLGIGQHFDIHVRGADEVVAKLGETKNLTDEMLKNMTQFHKEFSSTFDDAAVKIEKVKVGTDKIDAAWNKISSTLKTDIASTSLSKYEFGVFRINKQMDELVKKFGNKQLITEWWTAMRGDLVEQNVDSFKRGFEDMFNSIEPTIELPKSLQPKEFDTTYYDMQKAAIADVTDFDLASSALREQGTLDMFGNMAGAARSFYEASGEQNKAAFTMYKAFSIAQTAISTYQAAVDAYKSMVGIPIVGPGLAVAAAAAATAFGLAQINSIASMQPGGRPSGISAPSAPAIRNNNTYNNPTNNNQQITIVIDSGYQDPDQLVRDHIIPAIEKYTSYGGNVKFA